jgi:hypothetical protein
VGGAVFVYLALVRPVNVSLSAKVVNWYEAS